ncbi:MAG: hypothetical protein AAGC67_00095 [Myxococcota bacterium]
MNTHSPTLPQAPAVARPGRFHMFLGMVWLSVWMGNFLRPVFELLPVSPYYIMTALYVPYFLFLRLGDVFRVVLRPMFAIWFLTAAIPLLVYVGYGGGEHAYFEVRTRITYFSAVAGSAVLLASHAPKRTLQLSAAFVLVVSALVNLGEMVLPFQLSEAPGRAAGFHQNPNASAGVLIAALLVALDFRRQSFRGLVLATIGTLGVLVTFSRHGSAFVGLIWLSYLLGARGHAREALSIPTRFFTLLSGVFVAIIGIWALLNVFDLHSEALLRVQSLIGLDIADSAAQGRLENANVGLQLFLENMWTGLGIGSHDYLEIETHNTFLKLGIDYGVSGMLVLLLILAATSLSALRYGIWRSSSVTLLSVFFVYEALFSQTLEHNLAFACVFGALLSRALVAEEDPYDEAAPASRPNDAFGTTDDWNRLP